VQFCPYCHGYEVRDSPLGVIGGEDRAFSLRQAQLIRQWSDDVVFFPHRIDLEDHERELPLIPIRSGSGVWLEGVDGRRYLDAISSWWVNLFGHSNPRINAAITAQLGRLDCVVANAGITSMIKAEEMDDESWQTVIDTNLTGVWAVCRAAMPHLIEQGEGGSMVLTSSTAAYIGLANLSHYSAAKGGVVGLMQCLAVELGPHMIRVNTIHPTTVRTPMALNQTIFDLFLPGAGLYLFHC